MSQQQLLDSQLGDGMRGEQGHLRLQAAVQRTKLADPATRAAAAEARLGAAVHKPRSGISPHLSPYLGP